MINDYELLSKDTLTYLILRKGIKTWVELIEFVQSLPYGRNQNRNDLSLVLSQEIGTCSSKHALLKTVADLNNIPDVQLKLCIFEMNSINTPKIAKVLKNEVVDRIVEAHCYLQINQNCYDFTTFESDINQLKDDILFEKTIEPKDINLNKVEFHKYYLKDWIKNNKLPVTFEMVWQLRERCIKALSKSH